MLSHGLVHPSAQCQRHRVRRKLPHLADRLRHKVWAPTTAWLILGADKPILVDSSFRSVEDAKAQQYLTCRRSPEQELPPQLAKHDVTPEQVGLLVHTHAHMDHAGQDHLIPAVRILVQRRELQNAAAPDMYPVPFYDRLNVARLVHDHWPRVDVLDGEAEIVPGVRCVPMPGHTPGHQCGARVRHRNHRRRCGDDGAPQRTGRRCTRFPG